MTTFAMAVLADSWDLHHDFGAGGWIPMILGMLVFWGAIIALVVWFLRGRPTPGEATPQEVLRRRLADGSISVEEYAQRLEALESAKRPSPPASPVNEPTRGR